MLQRDDLAARDARAMVGMVLAVRHLDRLREDAALVVTELSANAARHARGAVVRLTRAGGPTTLAVPRLPLSPSPVWPPSCRRVWWHARTSHRPRATPRSSAATACRGRPRRPMSGLTPDYWGLVLNMRESWSEVSCGGSSIRILSPLTEAP